MLILPHEVSKIMTEYSEESASCFCIWNVSLLYVQKPLRLKQLIKTSLNVKVIQTQICSWCLNSHVYWRCPAGLWSYSLYEDAARYKWTPRWSHSLSFERLESYRCPLQISFHTPDTSTGERLEIMTTKTWILFAESPIGQNPSCHSHLQSSSAGRCPSKAVRWWWQTQYPASQFLTTEGSPQRQSPLEPATWRTRARKQPGFHGYLTAGNTEGSGDPPDPADQLYRIWFVELLQIRQLCQDTRAVLPDRRAQRHSTSDMKAAKR